MPVRLSLLFSVTTQAIDPTSAAAHSGGWSESFYSAAGAFIDTGTIAFIAQTRALLLSGLASIVGYRQQLVTISGNKLLPGGSASGGLILPGNYPGDLNAPQDSLMVNFQVATQPQSLRHRLACLPDTQVKSGEYSPDPTYKGYLTSYANKLITLGLGAITRDLTLPDSTVRGITGGVITTNTSTGAALKDYIRLRRVRDANGLPVEGSFLVQGIVTNTDGSVAYTVANPPTQTVTVPNGTARLDRLVFNAITSYTVNRLVVRKIGRPFAGYRGRRSKRRV